MKSYRVFSLFLACAMSTAIMAQSRNVQGRIVDAKSNEPLIGVTVKEAGTSHGVVTDLDGNFTISVSPDAKLLVSYVGYKNLQVPVKGKNKLMALLEENSEILNDVVVVGYGVQKKATLSGAVTSVKGEDLVKSPVTNVSNGLAGRLPGVFAISNTAEPGYDGSTIRIRGVNTFGNAEPLVVVDGVPGRSLERIDPSTIESLSVMKDASAAIYGAQAANGVIIITTKRGKQGKPTVDFSYNYGLSRPTTVPEMCNASEYATLLNEIDSYAGNTPRYTADEIKKFADGSDPWSYPNTDWFAETLKDWSPQSNTNVSVSGGTERTRYFLSMSAKTQDGFYRHSATKYKQYDLRSNFDVNLAKGLDLTANLSGRLEDRKFPTRSSENIFRMLMRSKPNMPAYWPDGTPGPDIEFGDNPVVICTDQTGYDRDKRYVLNGDFGLNIQIPYIQGLSLKLGASFDKTFRFRKIWQTPWYLYSWDGTSYGDNGLPLLQKGKKGYDDARLNQSSENNYNIQLSAILNYNRNFGENHILNATLGVERIKGRGDSYEAYRRYYISTAIDELFAGGQSEINNTGSSYTEARLNYFGRLNYAYKQKYLAEVVWRYQGSYIFEQSNHFGFFPGASLGYVISEEDYFKKTLPFIHFAKIRASWGQTGNDLINAYQYLASYSYNNLMYITNSGATYNQALKENVVPNKNVTWETATQENIGLDLQFLKGELAFTIDYFRNTRKDILWHRNASVPSTSGMTLPDENLGRVRNQGVDFDLSYHHRFGDVMFNGGLNGVYAKNKILFWDEAPGAPDYQKSTGMPIGAGLVYKAVGIYQTQEEIDNDPAHWPGARPGDIKFADINGDNKLDGNDRIRYNRTSVPTFTYGINLGAQYKGFDVTALLQGAMGGVFFQSTESGDFGNFLKSFYDNRWTEENHSTSYPRTYNRSNEYWVNQSNTFWIHSSDYIRLKNVEVGYTLPNVLTSKIKIERLRFYINGYNLLTIAPCMKDYDPENTSGRGYNYPLSKIINFGASITF